MLPSVGGCFNVGSGFKAFTVLSEPVGNQCGTVELVHDEFSKTFL